jgi:hypothetical protein
VQSQLAKGASRISSTICELLAAVLGVLSTIAFGNQHSWSQIRRVAISMLISSKLYCNCYLRATFDDGSDAAQQSIGAADVEALAQYRLGKHL